MEGDGTAVELGGWVTFNTRFSSGIPCAWMAFAVPFVYGSPLLDRLVDGWMFGNTIGA